MNAEPTASAIGAELGRRSEWLAAEYAWSAAFDRRWDRVRRYRRVSWWLGIALYAGAMPFVHTYWFWPLEVAGWLGIAGSFYFSDRQQVMLDEMTARTDMIAAEVTRHEEWLADHGLSHPGKE